jgi:hypothetical protein
LHPLLNMLPLIEVKANSMLLDLSRSPHGGNGTTKELLSC